MSKLIIVESPAKAKSIQKYLGKGYEVASSMGHVRDLPAARLSVDVNNDFAPKYVVLKEKEKLVKDLQQKAAKSDQVFLATDPDREGEAISWHLANLLRLDLKQENRVAFNEITKTGVLGGMAHPRRVDIDLVNAQQARRILDRLVGYRLSPFVSQKIRRGLSAGRVQSVALRLIVDREQDIRAFRPEEYWSIEAKLLNSARRTVTASFLGDQSGKVALKNKEKTDAILARLQNAQFWVAQIKKGQRKQNPAPPFNTSTLQQEASRRLGFQAQRTMRVAQELYEGVEVPQLGTMGLITYMRTDSLRISDEARAQAAEFITEAYGKQYLPAQPRFYKSRANAQDGHEAVRPTLPSLTPAQVKGSLSPDQFKLYDLIWKRFLASLMASCIQDTVKATILAANQAERQQGRHLVFTASGYTVRFDGFTALYVETKDEEEDEEKDGKLPALREGEALALKELLPGQHFTQPPARFTEASLIKALEESGVGRPSTYATIISTILHRGYVSRQAKVLSPTELGEALTSLLKDRFPNIVNVKFTAQLEDSLDEVGSGRTDYIALLHSFYDDFDATLSRAKEEMKDVKIKLEEDQTDIPCDKCGRMMVIKTGRYGRFLACPGFPECKNAKPLVVESKARCPVCGETVVQRKSKKSGRTFYGCAAWPKCEFVTWHTPTDEACPKCGKSLFLQRGGTKCCLNEGCGYTAKAEKKN
ncbi:MAG: type I DNA topoisomerase [Oscillospiraceae bacterium]|jgi:DNA topoisomerase-1|nr:type I DNA topoisomerase [Oscillospiraceae bacterium]